MLLAFLSLYAVVEYATVSLPFFLLNNVQKALFNKVYAHLLRIDYNISFDLLIKRLDFFSNLCFESILLFKEDFFLTSL